MAYHLEKNKGNRSAITASMVSQWRRSGKTIKQIAQESGYGANTIYRAFTADAYGELA